DGRGLHRQTLLRSPAQREARMRTILRADEILGKPADLGAALWIDPNQAYPHGDFTTAAIELKHGKDFHRGRHCRDLLVQERVAADALHHTPIVAEPFHGQSLDDPVGDRAVKPLSELAAEPAPDAVAAHPPA